MNDHTTKTPREIAIDNLAKYRMSTSDQIIHCYFRGLPLPVSEPMSVLQFIKSFFRSSK